ncbi:MAG: rhodanese-like domain-containing protein [Opitutaceae bacterium]|nr:rhodanese-like domain-containing protein [Verrucomicrobiales bacterium]
MKLASPFLLTLIVAAVTSSPLRAADQPKPAATGEANKSVRNVAVEEFDKMRKGTNVVVLDVRTAKEFSEGHLANAVNLDFYAPDFAQQLGKLDKSKTYLVHCAAGGRSAKACTTMTQLNFTNAVNLEGGYKAWVQAQKPVVLPGK